MQKVIDAGNGEAITAVFSVDSSEDLIATQCKFLEACVKDGMYRAGETIQVDNSKLRLEIGVAVFMDLTTGNCGYSHEIPGVILSIYCDAMRRKRPRLHWYIRYRGQQLPLTAQRAPW